MLNEEANSAVSFLLQKVLQKHFPEGSPEKRVKEAIMDAFLEGVHTGATDSVVTKNILSQEAKGKIIAFPKNIC